MTELAVRYRAPGDDEYTVLPSETKQTQADQIRDALLALGVAAEPVIVMVTVTLTVDTQLRDETMRELVAEVAGLILEGEIGLARGLERVRVLAPGLVDEDEIANLTVADRVHVHCTREYWLDHLVSTIGRIQGLKSGLIDPADYDSDAEDRHYEHALNVVAGVVEHTVHGRGCALHAPAPTAVAS